MRDKLNRGDNLTPFANLHTKNR